jgi:CheY-like chemotaxis protein
LPSACKAARRIRERRSREILVVDDDSDIISMMTAVLRANYTVIGAPDGKTAVKLWSSTTSPASSRTT